MELVPLSFPVVYADSDARAVTPAIHRLGSEGNAAVDARSVYGRGVYYTRCARFALVRTPEGWRVMATTNFAWHGWLDGAGILSMRFAHRREALEVLRIALVADDLDTAKVPA